MTKTIQKVNNFKILNILLSACCIIMLSGCSSKDDEAKKLGFSGYEEMEKIKILGFNTKSEYEESIAKKKIQQENLEKLKKEEEEKIAKDKEIQEQNIAEAATNKEKNKEIPTTNIENHFDNLQSELFNVTSKIRYDDPKRRDILLDFLFFSDKNKGFEYAAGCYNTYDIVKNLNKAKFNKDLEENQVLWSRLILKIYKDELNNEKVTKKINNDFFDYFVREGKTYADGQKDYFLKDSNVTIDLKQANGAKYSRNHMWITSCNMAINLLKD